MTKKPFLHRNSMVMMLLILMRMKFISLSFLRVAIGAKCYEFSEIP